MSENRQATPDETRLRELREARQKLEDECEARSLPTLEEQIALEERRLKETQALADLEAQHGKVGKEIDLVPSDVGAVIVKRPTMNVYRRFQDSGTNETKDLENLVRPCILYPSRAEFDNMIERLPMLLTHVADTCVVLAGLRAKQIKSK